jgi:hypothetical protein
MANDLLGIVQPHGECLDCGSGNLRILWRDDRVAVLEKEILELREEVQACMDFLATELGWEYFRADMLYHDDTEHQRQSLKNAQTIKNFLVSRGWRAGPDGAVRISTGEGDG